MKRYHKLKSGKRARRPLLILRAEPDRGPCPKGIKVRAPKDGAAGFGRIVLGHVVIEITNGGPVPLFANISF